jgi:hypothetical protein
MNGQAWRLEARTRIIDPGCLISTGVAGSMASGGLAPLLI